MSVFDDANNVAFYPFSSESSGVTEDVLGNHNITLIGAVINTTDPMVGPADVHGDGNDDKGVAANSDDFNLDATDPCGFSFFITPDAIDTQVYIAKSIGTGAGYRFGITSSKFEFRIIGSSGLLIVRPTINAVVGTKYHLVWNYDGSTNASGVKLYINGVRRATSIISDTLTAGGSNAVPFTILARSDSASWFEGNLDALLPRIGSQFTDDGVAVDVTAGGEVAELNNGGAGLEPDGAVTPKTIGSDNPLLIPGLTTMSIKRA